MSAESEKKSPSGGSSPEPSQVPSAPPSATEPAAPGTPGSTTAPAFAPLVTVVGFHHARGPEVETWFGAGEGVDPTVEYGWPLLPFMALSDGAHAYEPAIL